MGKKAKESVHIRVDRELFDKLEFFRKKSHSNILVGRSEVYCETLFYGSKLQELKKELGDKEFDRIWTLLTKLNLNKVDLEKFL